MKDISISRLFVREHLYLNHLHCFDNFHVALKNKRIGDVERKLWTSKVHADTLDETISALRVGNVFSCTLTMSNILDLV